MIPCDRIDLWYKDKCRELKALKMKLTGKRNLLLSDLRCEKPGAEEGAKAFLARSKEYHQLLRECAEGRQAHYEQCLRGTNSEDEKHFHARQKFNLLLEECNDIVKPIQEQLKKKKKKKTRASPELSLEEIEAGVLNLSFSSSREEEEEERSRQKERQRQFAQWEAEDKKRREILRAPRQRHTARDGDVGEKASKGKEEDELLDMLIGEEKNESLDFEYEDISVRQVIDLFKTYWKAILSNDENYANQVCDKLMKSIIEPDKNISIDQEQAEARELGLLMSLLSKSDKVSEICILDTLDDFTSSARYLGTIPLYIMEFAFRIEKGKAATSFQKNVIRSAVYDMSIDDVKLSMNFIADEHPGSLTISDSNTATDVLYSKLKSWAHMKAGALQYSTSVRYILSELHEITDETNKYNDSVRDMAIKAFNEEMIDRYRSKKTGRLMTREDPKARRAMNIEKQKVIAHFLHNRGLIPLKEEEVMYWVSKMDLLTPADKKMLIQGVKKLF